MVSNFHTNGGSAARTRYNIIAKPQLLYNRRWKPIDAKKIGYDVIVRLPVRL